MFSWLREHSQEYSSIHRHGQPCICAEIIIRRKQRYNCIRTSGLGNYVVLKQMWISANVLVFEKAPW